MKQLRFLLLILMMTVAALMGGACGSASPFGDAELPVTEISNRSTKIVQVLEAADLNHDGKIKGDGEWFALSSGAAQLFVVWATEALE